jgi:hypothetical protein
MDGPKDSHENLLSPTTPSSPTRHLHDRPTLTTLIGPEGTVGTTGIQFPHEYRHDESHSPTAVDAAAKLRQKFRKVNETHFIFLII